MLLIIDLSFCIKQRLDSFFTCDGFLNVFLYQIAEVVQGQHRKWLFNKNTNLKKLTSTFRTLLANYSQNAKY